MLVHNWHPFKKRMQKKPYENTQGKSFVVMQMNMTVFSPFTQGLYDHLEKKSAQNIKTYRMVMDFINSRKNFQNSCSEKKRTAKRQ